MSQLLQPYTLPLIYADLTSDEVLRDGIHSLTLLCNTVDTVFTKVETRVATEMNRLKEINSRVEKCLNKVSV